MKSLRFLAIAVSAALCASSDVGSDGAFAAEAATLSPAGKSDGRNGSKEVRRPYRLASDEAPALVGVDPVRMEPLLQTVPVIGRLVAVRSGKVSAEVAGAVRNLAVATGDRVEAGDLIAELDNEAINAQLVVEQSRIDESVAELAALRAELLLAEQDMNRQKDLERSGAFSRAKHEDAVRNVEKARANIVRAEAGIETRRAARRLTEITLGKSEIRAPYAGVVSEKLTERGAYVKAGDAIVSLVSDTNLEVEADVPSTRLGGLIVGRLVRFLLSDGRVFDATVRALLPTESPMTRTRPVRFAPVFEKPVAGLADSQTVTVNVPLGAGRKALTVHKDAIIKRGEKSLVYIVAGEVAEVRAVTLGESAGPRMEVVSGLKAGDNVIVRGNERLRPGAQVKIGTKS